MTSMRRIELLVASLRCAGWGMSMFVVRVLNADAMLNMLAPPGGLARAGTRSTVTTCDVYPQPFVVLVVMVLIFTVFFHIKCVFFRSRLHIMFSDAIDH